MSEQTYVGLVLEDQLLDHMATEEGLRELRTQRFDPEWINSEDAEVRTMLEWAFAYYREHGKPPTPDVLQFEFGIEFQEPQAPLDYVVEHFRKRYRRREAQKVIKSVARMVNEDPNGAVEIGFNEFTRIKKETVERKYITDSDNLDDVVERYKDRVLRIKNLPTFGFELMDKDLNGIEGLVFCIARPKRYKSWLGTVWPALQNQLAGKTSVVYTLEMPKEEMLDRYAIARAGLSWKSFKAGALTPEDLDYLRAIKAENELHPNKVHFLRPPVGQRTVGHMHMTAQELGADVIFIDQLKWIESTRRTVDDSRWREVEFICEDLKEMANEIPTLCNAQFNREAANLTEMADLSKIGLSDAIGQTADLLLGIYSSKEMKQSGIVEYGVIDSRNFEPVRFDVKVELSKDGGFRILNKKDEW